VPHKQTGKKHGKRIVNQGDGFVSVAYEGGHRQVVGKLTNRKDLECVAMPYRLRTSDLAADFSVCSLSHAGTRAAVARFPYGLSIAPGTSGGNELDDDHVCRGNRCFAFAARAAPLIAPANFWCCLS
jgi:hypothetical protein